MKKTTLFTCILGLGVLVSCQKESVETSDNSTISGAAVKGYVDAARVDVYQYKEKGQRGTLLATTTTDNKGNFEVSANYRGPVEIVVSQGKYADEATGTTVHLENNELRSVAYLGQEKQSAAVTALTTIAAAYVDSNATANVEASIKDANAKVAAAFGIADVDITGQIPADLSQANAAISKAQAKYGAIQAGLSQTIKDRNLSADQLLTLVKDISKDYTDQVLDGKSGSVALESALEITPNEALTGLNTAMNNFMNSPKNKSGYSAQDMGISVPTPGGR
jgi:hypothetical protein